MSSIGDVNVELLIEILLEEVIAEGEVVFEKMWDSGGPGAGAGSEDLIYWRECYVYVSDGVFHGPWARIEDALKGPVAAITEATTGIEYDESHIDERTLRKALSTSVLTDRPTRILINGEAWIAHPGRPIRRAPAPRR